MTKAGTGIGTVTGGPINCGAVCSATVVSGTVVTLSQTHNNALFAFVGWGGACSGLGACVVNVNAATSVIATFNKRLKPPVRCRVPHVIGKKLGPAATAIAKAHCKLGKVTRIGSTDRRKGKVITQSPAPGKVKPKGTKVNLQVGRGR